ncbi:cytochrome P450 [Streptomyces sp. DSM 44938]|uniref:Cytochrome P450 n=1 Tax=Streptomyces litchfieldiae TaxID=3075543 RepID=A0ABU2MRI0_9ACTN|nr:cytochrome P450 [Streptomyces sp. DSM 44938]MDT0343209.1 cytochrome P450 [Streptomyces sp. DSM 44938]
MTTAKPQQAPTAAPGAVPLSGPRFHTDPARLYREMRQEHGPVVPVVLPGDIPAWLVVGYRELHHVTGDTTLFTRDMGLWNQWPNIPDDWPLLPMVNRRQPSIYYTVGAEHQRHVDMVVPALEAVDPFELRRHAEEIADALIDAFCGQGEAELITGYAKLLPILVLGRIIGFPDSEGPELTRAINALADGGEDAIAAHRYVQDAMSRLLAAKRAAPGADVASRMLACPGFTDEEYILDLTAITAAGHLPTSDWIGNSLRLMLTDDRFAASLSGGRHSVGEAMNEVLWEDTPTQILAGRWASRDTSLGGQRVQAGDMLLLGLQGAHGDPGIQGEGQATTGGNNAHFSFSHGEFRCPFPAQEIAEVIARTGIEVLLDRLPDIDLADPSQTLTRRPSPFLRGMTALPVRFTPTSALGSAR